MKEEHIAALNVSWTQRYIFLSSPYADVPPWVIYAAPVVILGWVVAWLCIPRDVTEPNLDH